jgi:hypothetical protein
MLKFNITGIAEGCNRVQMYYLAWHGYNEQYQEYVNVWFFADRASQYIYLNN